MAADGVPGSSRAQCLARDQTEETLDVAIDLARRRNSLVNRRDGRNSSAMGLIRVGCNIGIRFWTVRNRFPSNWFSVICIERSIA